MHAAKSIAAVTDNSVLYVPHANAGGGFDTAEGRTVRTRRVLLNAISGEDMNVGTNCVDGMDSQYWRFAQSSLNPSSAAAMLNG